MFQTTEHVVFTEYAVAVGFYLSQQVIRKGLKDPSIRKEVDQKMMFDEQT